MGINIKMVNCDISPKTAGLGGMSLNNISCSPVGGVLKATEALIGTISLRSKELTSDDLRKLTQLSNALTAIEMGETRDRR